MKIAVMGKIHIDGLEILKKANLKYFEVYNFEDKNLKQELKDVDGIILAAQFFRLGRLNLYYMTPDGGETGYWDSCLESFTLMSAIASVTSSIGLFPSISILSQHPAVVARMIATIDDVKKYCLIYF